MIDFNRPAFVGKELSYIEDAIHRGMLCGDGEYTKKCSRWMEERFHAGHVMLTTSCRCFGAPGSEDRVCGYPSGYHEYQ